MTKTNKSLYEIFHKNSKIQYRVISENNFTYIEVIKTLRGIFKKYKISNVLDYGCGVGTLSLYIGKKGINVTGFDVSDSAIRQAKENALNLGLFKKTHFFTIDKMKRVLRGKYFDLIILIEVIEHLPNDFQTLKFLTSHLNKHGLLVITTPSVNAPLYKLGLLNRFDKRVGHIRRYNEDMLKKLHIKLNQKILMIDKKESFLRNSFYTFSKMGWIIKFMKGPISDYFMLLDNFLVKLFGESDYFVVSEKL
jgi:2-polyprenyl-3-methyl-5-hydroxy-6-metoxy-1,4-benzoquinol methylase